MDTPLPPAHELALIDGELAQLEARRGYLLARRDWLLRLLAAQPAPSPQFGPVAGPVSAPVSKPSAQNVLLTLGAVLLAVAALAFTLVSWGSLGIGGRSAVLALLTAAALAAPAALLRRGLRSTAEAVAGVGLLLTVLDAYAVHAVGLSGADPVAYAAGASAVLAGVWAGYGAALGRLRLPVLAAVGAAQLPLPLAAAAAGAGPLGAGAALLATAALDAALASAVVRRAVRVPAWVCSGVLGGTALAVGLARSLAEPGAAGPALLLAAGGLLGVAVARREPRASAAALVGGLAVVSAAGALVPAGTGSGWWAVAARVAAALALSAAAVRAGAGAGWGAGAVPGAVRRGLLRAGAAVAALGALAGLAAVAVVLVARAVVLREVWAATTPPQGGPGAGLAVALLLAAAALWLPGGVLPRPVAGAAAVVCGWAALFVAPMPLGLPAWAVLAAQLGVAAAAGVAAVRAAERAVAFAAGGCAAVGALSVSLAALDGRAATFAVFGLLGACCALGAAHRAAAVAVRAGCAVGAVGYAAGLAVALGAVAGLPWSWRAVAVLAVPALVAALAPRLGPVRVAAEAAAAGAEALAVAVALAAGDAPVLALVLGLAGTVCAGAALRPERRALGWAAGVLFVAAAWVRLAAWGVAVPEAYALPVAVPALAVGLLRRRRGPGASSWSAYGPGLGAALLPSLVAAWGDAHWQRPLLLGTAALALTLAGAHRRLQAPLLLGGAVLAAVALHELAPYVVQVVGVLPRWLPPALAGLLLLVMGATYERRLRDARRLREAIGRLR